MSEKHTADTESKPAPSQQNRVRKPLIMTKKQAQGRRFVTDSKERQERLQKEHTKAFKAAQKGETAGTPESESE